MRPMTDKATIPDQALGYDVVDKRIDILRRVGELGSISEAARAAGVSYKAAWQAVDTLTNLARVPLVERTVGGSGGGGAQLTDAGHQLLDMADTLHAMRQQLANRAPLPAARGLTSTPAVLALQTSMRNQLPCTLLRIRKIGRTVVATLRLDGGALLSSNITRESAELLGLTPGTPLLALAKATAVRMAPDTSDNRNTDTGNCLAGSVSRIARSTSGDEVVLTLHGGQQLVGFCAPGVRLSKGDAALARVEAASVVLARQ